MLVSEILKYDKYLYNHLYGLDTKQRDAGKSQWQKLMSTDLDINSSTALQTANELLVARDNKPWRDSDVVPFYKNNSSYNGSIIILAAAVPVLFFYYSTTLFLSIPLTAISWYLLFKAFVGVNNHYNSWQRRETGDIYDRVQTIASLQNCSMTCPGPNSYFSYAIVSTLNFVYKEKVKSSRMKEEQERRLREIAEAEAAKQRQIAEAEAAKQRQIADEQRQAARRQQAAVAAATAATAGLAAAETRSSYDDEDDYVPAHISYNPSNGYAVIDNTGIDVGGHIVGGGWDSGGFDNGGGWDEW